MKNQTDHFQQVAAEYDQMASNGVYATLAPHNKGGRKSEYLNAVFDEAILSKLPVQASCGSILDFGCGTGTLTQALAIHCERVVGVDISEQMVASAVHNCDGYDNVRIIQIDGESLPLNDASFDFVVARESLCHVPDEMLGDVLSEIFRVIKPGGRFFWLEQVSKNAKWQHHPEAPSLVKRDPQWVREYLIQGGFNLLEESMVRAPRFPWIYPIWFGIFPRRWIPTLARWELAFHRRFNIHPSRWWHGLFIAERPST